MYAQGLTFFAASRVDLSRSTGSTADSDSDSALSSVGVLGSRNEILRGRPFRLTCVEGSSSVTVSSRLKACRSELGRINLLDGSGELIEAVQGPAEVSRESERESCSFGLKPPLQFCSHVRQRHSTLPLPTVFQRFQYFSPTIILATITHQLEPVTRREDLLESSQLVPHLDSPQHPKRHIFPLSQQLHIRCTIMLPIS